MTLQLQKTPTCLMLLLLLELLSLNCELMVHVTLTLLEQYVLLSRGPYMAQKGSKGAAILDTWLWS